MPRVTRFLPDTVDDVGLVVPFAPVPTGEGPVDPWTTRSPRGFDPDSPEGGSLLRDVGLPPFPQGLFGIGEAVRPLPRSLVSVGPVPPVPGSTGEPGQDREYPCSDDVSKKARTDVRHRTPEEVGDDTVSVTLRVGEDPTPYPLCS